MEVTTRGIVLHTLKYNDTTLIADVLTEAEGFRSFAVAVSTGRRSTGRYRLYQPLARLTLSWTERRQGGLLRARNVEGLPYATIPLMPDKTAVSLFLAEFLHAALRNEPPQPHLFEYIWKSVEWLDASTEQYANFHIVFLLRLSRFLGFYPNLEDYREGMYFDLETSTFSDTQPFHSHFLTPDIAALLPKIMRMKYATMHVFRFSGSERSQLLSFIVDYYRLHVPSFPRLRSLDVLREVFGGVR